MRPYKYRPRINKYQIGGKTAWDVLDNVADKTESVLAPVTIGLGTASFFNPSFIIPYEAASLLGSGIDIYQTARSLYNKDYKDAAWNGGEALLGIVGAKGAYKLGSKELIRETRKFDREIANKVREKLGRSPDVVKLRRKGVSDEDIYKYILKKVSNSVTNSKDFADHMKDKKRKAKDRETKWGIYGDITGNASSIVRRIDGDYIHNLPDIIVTPSDQRYFNIQGLPEFSIK